MKIKLEFERHDLEEMLGSYFGRLGFRVKNLDELCTQFGEAFPQGLVVQAEITDAPIEPVDALNDEPLAIERHVEPEVKEPEQIPDERLLSFTDLMDPTMRTREDEERDAAEIRKIRNKSNGLAARKN